MTLTKENVAECLEHYEWYYDEDDKWSMGTNDDYCEVFIRADKVYGSITHTFNHEISDKLKTRIEEHTNLYGIVKTDHDERGSAWIWYHEQELLDEEHLVHFVEACSRSSERYSEEEEE